MSIVPLERGSRSSTAPAVIWLTGLPGAGKSTLGRAVAERLEAMGRPVEFLDGDVIRSMFPGTGFSREGRDAQVARVGRMASHLEQQGLWVVCALVSPYAEARRRVRSLCRRFVEVHVSTTIEECERRDPKGLYARARRGEIRQFTGIDDPYEPPVAPDVAIDTTHINVQDGVELVLGGLSRVMPWPPPAERSQPPR